MKKKLSIFAVTLVLLLNTCIFAYAAPQYYGYGQGSGESAKAAEQLYKDYGIEAYLAVDNDMSGSTSASELANTVSESVGAGNNTIIFAITSTNYYICGDGLGYTYIDPIDVDALYDDLEADDLAGDYEAATQKYISFLDKFFADQDIQSDGYYCVDTANLLTDSEREALEAKLAEISGRQKFDVVIVTVDSTGTKTPEEYADDFYDYAGYGQGDENDGVCLLISKSSRDWWISTTGYGITVFTDKGIEYIGEAIVQYLKDDDWNGGLNEFADQADKFITEAKTDKPYDVGHMPKKIHSVADNLKAAGIAIVVAVVVALIVASSIKKSYKPVRFNKTANNYLVDGSLQITGSYDNFMYSNVTQTRIESNSSGGGSSTHTGSSGTSHGGGGGKF